jgi:hypothetical protein
LQNKKLGWQRWHDADMAAIVVALPGKNWPWRPRSNLKKQLISILVHFLEIFV